MAVKNVGDHHSDHLFFHSWLVDISQIDVIDFLNDSLSLILVENDFPLSVGGLKLALHKPTDLSVNSLVQIEHLSD